MIVLQTYYVGWWDRLARLLRRMPQDRPRPSVLRVILDEPELRAPDCHPYAVRVAPRSWELGHDAAAYGCRFWTGDQAETNLDTRCWACEPEELPSSQEAVEMGWVV